MTFLEALRARARPRLAIFSRPAVRARAADLGTLGAVAAVYALFSRAFLYTAIGFDEQYFLSEGFAVARGLVPYRDFQEFKPPLVFLLNALAIKIFGVADMRFRWFFWLLAAGAFAVVAVALLSRGVPRLVVVAVEALMLNTFFDGRLHEAGSINTAETAGLCFFLLGVGVLLFDARRPDSSAWQKWQPWLGGALLAFAPLGKEPFLFPTLLAWVALVLLHDAESEDRTAWKTYAKRMVFGAITVAGLLLFYLLVTRSLGWYLLQLRETMRYSADHNEMYGVFPKLPFLASWAECWRRLSAKYVNAAYLAAFVPYFLAALIFWPRRRVALPAAIAATFFGALYAVTIGHGFFGHYFIMALSGSFFGGIMGAVALGRRLRSVDAPFRHWVALALAGGLFFVLQPRLAHDADAWDTFRPKPPPVSQRLIDLVRRRTKPADRIWNVGMPGIYVFSDRRLASRIPYVHDSLLHIYPGDTDAQRLAPYRTELDEHMPKLVILSEGAKGREKHMNLLITPFLRDHGYRLVVESPATEVPVYERPY